MVTNDELWKIANNSSGVSRLVAAAMLQLRTKNKTTITQNCTLHLLKKKGGKEFREKLK